MSFRQRQGQVGTEDFPQAPSKPNLRKGLWCPEEDQKLIAYIVNNGMLGCSWANVAKQAGLHRCGKSCRLRWVNYLRPGLKRGAFSRREEQLIINLQSIIGNRWSQIAAHMPGRTDNEIKNYCNSTIKKKLKLKEYRCSNSNCKYNVPSHCDRICKTNSLFSHGHDAFTSSRSVQPYLDAMPEAYQTPKNTFNAVTTGENQFYVPGVLELKKENVLDQVVDSYFKMWIDNTSTHTHEAVSSHTAFVSPSLQVQGLPSCNTTISPTFEELIIESCRTTVSPLEAPASAPAPAVAEREFSKEKIENDGWSTSRSDFSHVIDPRICIAHEAGISLVEDLKSLYEKNIHQSCPPISLRYEFGAAAIQWPVGQSNDFQAEDDSLDLRYDVNLGGTAQFEIDDDIYNLNTAAVSDLHEIYFS